MQSELRCRRRHVFVDPPVLRSVAAENCQDNELHHLLIMEAVATLVSLRALSGFRV